MQLQMRLVLICELATRESASTNRSFFPCSKEDLAGHMANKFKLTDKFENWLYPFQRIIH